ncbi:hypothetical protein JR338_07630 [Chloroflexota bacterium]|nr:hypothetical protein JR338_07630 [Chloroflexota bacterium]
MEKYYVNSNAQSGSEHEVHQEGCSYMPDHPLPLGYCKDCWEALEKAKDHFGHVDGCFYCCFPCHRE